MAARRTRLLRRPCLLVLLAAVVLVGGPAAVHQAAASEQAADEVSEPAPPVATDPFSPRAALQTYLDLCRSARFADAARYLDPSGLPRGLGGATAARQLKAVLDRHIWFELDTVSPHAAGDLQDGLEPEREALGSILTPRGPEPVEMIRRSEAVAPGWVFAPETVARIPEWYGELGTSWLRSVMPAVLVRPGPLELQWWQWLMLPVAAALAWVVARLAASLLRLLLGQITARTRSGLDDLLLDRLFAPGVFLLALAVFRAEMVFLDLTIPAEEFIDRSLRALLLVGIFWILTRLVDVGVLTLDRSPWMDHRPEVRAVLPFVARMGRLLVLALGVVTVLQEFEFTVTGLLATMGLAGMAAALAGQKSVENLLGSATILADRPFRVGDFVRVEDLVGTVEEIGLRSTRIRTLDRTLVTIPNGRLSEMRLETFAARDRIRLYCVLGLTYSTTSGQLAAVIRDLEQALREHPRIVNDPIRVRFVEFADFALKIEVFAFMQTTDWGEFLGLRQEVFLKFMEVVERNGCAFAFPTRTLHLEPAELTIRREAPQPAASARS